MPVRSMGEEFFSIGGIRRLACISYQIEEPSLSLFAFWIYGIWARSPPPSAKTIDLFGNPFYLLSR